MTSRPWLYIIAGITLITTINTNNKVSDIKEQLVDQKRVQNTFFESTSKNNNINYFRENILGDNNIKEAFYVIGSDTVLLEADGIQLNNENLEKLLDSYKRTNIAIR